MDGGDDQHIPSIAIPIWVTRSAVGLRSASLIWMANTIVCS